LKIIDVRENRKGYQELTI